MIPSFYQVFNFLIRLRLIKLKSIIKKLSPHEAQKIAAGEVVERPINVIKELLENALDAGATSITLEFIDAGKARIRIIDNGCGMTPQDARICTQQYATSKIISVDQLNSITTFGFRGEALASIAAVCQLKIITRHTDSDYGTQINFQDGAIFSEEPTACPTGTDITVDNLFFNIPARKKFLKKRETEWRLILQLIHALCLDNLNLHVKVMHDNKQILNCPAVTAHTDRITQLWGHEAARDMLALNAGHDTKKIHISGVISNHQIHRFDRNNIFFFVNNRWIKNYTLSRALIKGYANVLPSGRYPTGAIFITVDPQTVDINIHPRKEEVQFLNPRSVEQLIQTSVKKTLEDNLTQHIKKPVTFESYQPTSFESFTQELPPAFIPTPFTNTFQTHPHPSPTYHELLPTTSTSYPHQQSPVTQIKTISNSLSQSADTLTQQKAIQKEQFNIVGYYKKTYILLAQDDGISVIDQHAAHERILYELFNKRFTEVATVGLLFPTIIRLSEQDTQRIAEHISLFTNNGISLEVCGTQELIIKATPVHLKNQSLDDLVKQVASWLQNEEHVSEKELHEMVNKKLRAQMACKAAVKAGDELSSEKINQLIRDLHKTENRLTCPHGRPTSWVLSDYDIEKKFKRKK